MNPSDTIGERVARLETSMAAVLTANVSREAFQNSALETLTTIKMRQEDALGYQKACDAERDAHEKRITNLENSKKVVLAVAAIVSASITFVVTNVLTFLRHP